MSIKTIAQTYDKIKAHENVMDAMADADLQSLLKSNRVDFQRQTELAEATILERLGEKDFVRFMLIVQRTVSALIVAEGGEALLLADADGSLQMYTHSVVLAVIGALIEDEVL